MKFITRISLFLIVAVVAMTAGPVSAQQVTGTLNKLTIKVDRPQLSPADIKKLEAAMRNNKMSE
jgi:uncharacterized protein YcfL